MSWWLTLQLASTLPLAGLIWTIAIVTYPQFADIPADGFQSYHRKYTARITLVVLPLMVVEFAACAAMLVMAPTGANVVATLAVIGVWLITFTMSVPAHNRLAAGFDARHHKRLLLSNWIRVLLWTARAAWLIAVVHSHWVV